MVDLRNYRTRGLPLLAGFVNGALAYVAGLIGSFVLFVAFGLKPLVRMALVTIGGFPFFEAVGFAFYGGHFVSVSTGTGSVNFALDLANSGVLYVLLVLVILGGTGYYLGSADWVGTGPLGFVVGALQVLGYLPLAALGITLFSVEMTAESVVGEGASEAAMWLPTVEGIVLAGILFPAVVGGLGGAVAAQS